MEITIGTTGEKLEVPQLPTVAELKLNISKNFLIEKDSFILLSFDGEE